MTEYERQLRERMTKRGWLGSDSPEQEAKAEALIASLVQLHEDQS